MTDVCCLSVCLSVSLHLSVLWYLSEGSDPSKYVGINEAMNDVLTCHTFNLLCLGNTFKCKTKPKSEVRFWIYHTFHHQKKERLEKGVCIFPKSALCKVHLVAVWTAAYVTLFTALIPLPCVDEECWNVDCVSSVFRAATLRTYNYYICRFVRRICIY
jgi:hypothetical protein